jgi:hypothetical protein
MCIYFFILQLGCFYGGEMFGCTGEGDDVSYEPFVGRRKRLDTRSYTGPDDRPWNMKWKDTMDEFY